MLLQNCAYRSIWLLLTVTIPKWQSKPTNENFYLATIFVALTAPFICFPSICLWALFGSSIKMLIKNAKIKKIIEYFLAVLLFITAIIILLNEFTLPNFVTNSIIYNILHLVCLSCFLRIVLDWVRNNNGHGHYCFTFDT